MRSHVCGGYSQTAVVFVAVLVDHAAFAAAGAIDILKIKWEIPFSANFALIHGASEENGRAKPMALVFLPFSEV